MAIFASNIMIDSLKYIATNWLIRSIITGIIFSGVTFFIIDRALQGYTVALESHSASILSMQNNMTSFSSEVSSVNAEIKQISSVILAVKEEQESIQSLAIENGKIMDKIVLSLKAKSKEDGEYFGDLLGKIESIDNDNNIISANGIGDVRPTTSIDGAAGVRAGEKVGKMISAAAAIALWPFIFQHPSTQGTKEKYIDLIRHLLISNHELPQVIIGKPS